MGLWETVLEKGSEAVKQLGTQINSGMAPMRDHIPAQNETHQHFAATLEQYNMGSISAATAREEILKWNNYFQMLVSQIGGARALRGGGEINALAQSILGRLGGPTGGGIILPPTGGTAGGGGIGGALASLDPATIALVGVGLMFLLARRKS